ncbi:MAG: hypothetical protein ACFFD4_13945 [Candidatus Odinarchaeota archaeon]
MDEKDIETLLLLTQFARRPGLSIYHYAVLTTLDEQGRPYSRIRSPTVNKPYEMVMEEIDKQLAGQIHTRYSKEKLLAAKELDTKYKDVIDKFAWHILCYDETAPGQESTKQSIANMERDPHAHMVFMEAKVLIDPKTREMTYQRGTKDILMDFEVSNISRRGEPLYEHRSDRYLLLLADTHLATYENKEERYYSTVHEVWTGKPTDIRVIEQKKLGPVELLEDFIFTNKGESLAFLKKHNMGTIAIKDPETGKPLAVPTEFDVDLSLGEGVFWPVNTSLHFIKEMHDKLVKIAADARFVSICTPAFGTRYELGIAIEGDFKLEGEEIDEYKQKTGFNGVLVFVTPRRIANISPSESRRGIINIIQDDWK